MRENLRKNVMRRRAKLIREHKAVSPVVATLILILVAVAAAAALYLWLVAWQGGVTGNIGSPNAQYTVTIGGSTSVYPFDSVAVAQFEQNNTNIVVSNNQGGTGAGALAVCHGAVDVGAASVLETVSGLETNDGCPATTVINTVAYDAVDVIVASSNPHGLQSISYDTVTAVYDGGTFANIGTVPSLAATSIDFQPIATTPILDVAPWSTHAVLAWDQIPACVFGATNCGGAGNPTEALATSVGPGAACGAGVDICATGAGASPCGFTVCAGPFTGTTGTDAIVPVERSDASGTTQTFEARILGATSASAFASSTTGLGFNGCGSSNLLTDCGINVKTQGEGNPGVISDTAASTDALGYASDGLVRASGSGVVYIPFAGVGQTGLTGNGVTAGGVVPSTGASGSIASGVDLFSGTAIPSANAQPYTGVRPFEWITTNTPTGEVQRLLEFVLDPANNQNLANEANEVSVYSI